MSDDGSNRTEAFLERPLLRKATGLGPYLEMYSAEWRAGAQAIGYREAAETLLDVVIAKERHTSKTLLHPILFLYRHSIELRIKRLAAEYGGGTSLNGHDLDKLWLAGKDVIRRYRPDTDFDKIDQAIAELHSIDPLGQTFRYAITRQGKPIEIEVSEVDLVHLRKHMEDLDTFFWGIEIEITEAQSYLAEIVDSY